MQMKITIATICRHRHLPGAACRRPGWGNCSRCGRCADLTGGQKSAFRRPRYCDACLRRIDDQKGKPQ